jgi:hypothetical protein
MLNLAGFTYGMRGFLVAAPASLIASAVVFVVMRYLSRGDFRSWSEKNEKWQALEAVIVRIPLHVCPGSWSLKPTERQRTPSRHSHQSISFPTMGIFKPPVFGAPASAFCAIDELLTEHRLRLPSLYNL